MNVAAAVVVIDNNIVQLLNLLSFVVFVRNELLTYGLPSEECRVRKWW